RRGLEGRRSGLWLEYSRLIGEIRPRYVIVENVTGLLSLGMGTVLGDLASIGYDAEWHCIPATAVGAPHRRDRVWIVAHSDSSRVYQQPQPEPRRKDALQPDRNGQIQSLANANSQRQLQSQRGEQDQRRRVSDCGSPMADAERLGRGQVEREDCGTEGGGRPPGPFVQSGFIGRGADRWWSSEPNVGR